MIWTYYYFGCRIVSDAGVSSEDQWSRTVGGVILSSCPEVGGREDSKVQRISRPEG